MTDVQVDGRALHLFEMVAEHPDKRSALLADEAPAVLAALATLEEADRRARLAFPTEDDERPRRRALALPTRIGTYRLGERLGEGGMGLVFAADRADGLFEHKVAVKLIHPDRFNDRALARFADERRLLARLDHPGIARLIDGGIAADGWPYIIMERVGGVVLDVAATALPNLRDRVALLEQVYTAVLAAHAALVVHGDLKPANMLVDPNGRVRLLDFGVARLIDDTRPAGLQPLTAAFASPAQRAGAPPGVPDDVYALGMLLRAVASAGSPDAHLRAPADADLAAIADRATATDPEARYRSVDAFASDLARWRFRRPVEARRWTPWYLLARFSRRRRAPLAVGIVLVLLALVSVLSWQAASHRSALAAARGGALRQLARYQLASVVRRLEHQPRSTLLRRDLAREAEQVLARAAVEPGASRSLRIEAAEGYRLLARVEGAPGGPSLGDTRAADASLRRAEQLIGEDRTPAGRTATAAVLADRARLAAAASDTSTALALLDRAARLADAAPSRLRDDLDLLRADTLVWNGDYAAARLLDASVWARNARPPSTREEALRQDTILDQLSEATFYGGDPAGALLLYQTATAALESALRRWRGDAELDWALARNRWNTGTTLLELGRPAQGAPLLEQARAAAARWALDDPDDAVASRRLRSYELAAAQAQAALGHYAPAVGALEANIASRRRWADSSPASAERARDLAIAVAALGDVHAAAHHRDRACARYVEVGAIHARLAALHRLARLDSGYFEGLVRASAAKLGCGSPAD